MASGDGALAMNPSSNPAALSGPTSSSDAGPLSAPEAAGDPAEDPYSPGLIPLNGFLGALIGLLSLTVPLAAVLGGRPEAPGTFSFRPMSLHGSQPATGLPSARAGEPGGGDPGGIPQ